MIKGKVEDILLTHILTGEIEVSDHTIESHEDIIWIEYKSNILARLFVPKNFFKTARMIIYSSDFQFPGRGFYSSEEDLLKDVKKINHILISFS